MKAISTALAAHLGGDVTTLAFCCLITRTDGVVLGFTSSDQAIAVNGVEYVALGGFQHTALEAGVDLTPDNFDIQAVLDDASITEADLLAGKFDNAKVRTFLVNYQALPADLTGDDFVNLSTGTIGRIRTQQGTFVAEVDGLAGPLSQQHLELYTPSCRAKQLGDHRCKVDTDAFTIEDTVLTVIDGKRFTHGNVQPDDYFRYGVLRWVTGDNDDISMAVKTYVGGQVELLDALPAAIQIGDRFKVTRGCDRQFSTCRDVFDNVVNFRGEPPHLLPGADKIMNPLGS